MRRHRLVLALSVAVALAAHGGAIRAQAPAPAAPAGVAFDRYHTPQEISAALQALNKAHPAASALHKIVTSPGGRDVLAIEIGPETAAKARKLPAILVVANLEGTVPLSSEAALYLADTLFGRADATKDLTWYLVPVGSPDAAQHYVARPLVADERNASKHNDDGDEQADEDGPDDLNGDGVITEMRVKDPMGEWMPVPGDPRLMKRADPAKGEKGVYRIYAEGLDNDGDGEYNEDPAGGTNIGVTFPHLFKPFQPASGLYPGSEPETFGLIQFVMAHPEIAMTIGFGSTNFCLNPPRGGRQGSADLTQIKIPERIASRFGADPNRTYTMQEIMDMVRPMVPPGFELNESIIASFLGLGAVVNPLDDDLKFYREISDRYKEFLKTAKLDGKRQDPAPDKDGAFELWSYYHLGLPSFTMDFWTLPEPEEAKIEKSGITADTLEAMTNEAFLALGEAKVGAFLKEVGAPPNIAPAMLIQGVQSGRMTPKQMAGMLRQMPKPKDTSGGDPKIKALLAFSDKDLQGKGFVTWTAFTHPTLGEVEIGGPVPFADTTPPASSVRALLDGQVPWVFDLAKRLPRLKVLRTEAVARGGGVYDVTVWVENRGYLPFPTAMGKRNQHPRPAVLILKGAGVTLLSGRERTPVLEVGGGASVKLRWLVHADKPAQIDLVLESPNAWNDAAQIRLGGAR